MKIKEFCNKYNGIKNEDTKKAFLDKNLKVKTYIPFLEKESLAKRIVQATSYEYSFSKDGVTQTKDIQLNSVARYILYVRVMIETYTNLEIETNDFYEEYDVLVTSNILNILLIEDKDKGIEPLIPKSEIAEFKFIMDMVLEDVISNYTTPYAFIKEQFLRLSDNLSVSLEPVLTKIATGIENVDDSKIEKLGKLIDRGLKKIKA